MRNMGSMNLKDIILDSIRYSTSNLKAIIPLGLVLLIADMADELSWAGDFADELKIVLSFIVILLAFFEAGYVFRILEETVKGSKKLPHFNNFKLLFIHGFKELLVLFAYFLIPIFLFFLFFFEFLFSMDLNDVGGGDALLFIIFLSVTLIIYAFFPAVLLHRAHNNGNIRSSFDFRKIYHKIRNVGFKRLIVVYLGIFILVSIVKLVLSDSIASTIPVVGEIIPDLIIAPFLLIFTTRVLGLIDRP
jgi:hypothetical protein